MELIENNLSININNKVIEVLKEDNNILEPLIYIYNTHDEEKYYYNKYNVFNIVPDVKIASYILKERLDDLGK